MKNFKANGEFKKYYESGNIHGKFNFIDGKPTGNQN
jgi:antitoxin component YwqK of YwqJK toxin-antitoxin module